MLHHKSILHGPAHMMRVFILQELIATQLEREGLTVNREATRWAASVHDIGRVDDGDDLEHGTRSAEWMRNHVPNNMSPEAIDVATYIVHWHTPEDEAAPTMTTELKILKDADGLDRIRLGDLDARFLRTNAAHQLIELAQQLYEGSLPDDSFQSVLYAATKLNLIEE